MSLSTRGPLRRRVQKSSASIMLTGMALFMACSGVQPSASQPITATVASVESKFPPVRMPGDICLKCSADKYLDLVWNAFIFANHNGPPEGWLTFAKDVSDTCETWTGQLKTQPIWDINGNKILFDTRLNPKSTSHYKAGGKNEISSTCARKNKQMQWGRHLPYAEGPYHFKYAWKKLVADDCMRGRRFILRSGGLGCTADAYGAVAVHVTTKADTANDHWLWGTFSHIDNMGEDGTGMFAPCTPDECNVCPTAGDDGKMRTRIDREWKTRDVVHARNRHYRDQLTAHRGLTPLAQYELLDIQHVAGREPEPRQAGLGSEIIEWDRQDFGCIECHVQATVSVYSHGDHQLLAPRRSGQCENPACQESGSNVCHEVGECQCRRRVIDLMNEKTADLFWGLDRVHEEIHGSGSSQTR